MEAAAQGLEEEGTAARSLEGEGTARSLEGDGTAARSLEGSALEEGPGLEAAS